MRRTIQAMLLVGWLAAMSAWAAQGQLQIGDAFPGFSSEDQHGEPYTFEAGTRAVLIAFDMSGSRQANHALAVAGEGYLDTAGTITDVRFWKPAEQPLQALLP